MSKVAYTVGRFQPPTIGHQMLIEETIRRAEGGRAYVFVSKTVDNLKSPLPIALKLPILRHMFEGRPVEFVDTSTCTPACGGPGAALNWLLVQGHTTDKIIFVIGKERLGDPTSKEYFGPEAPLWGDSTKPRPGQFVPVGHSVERNSNLEVKDAENMSGTKARKYACKKRKADFYMALGYPDTTEDRNVEDAYKKIREVVCSSSRGGGDEEGPIPTGGPDGEPNTGVRRRKSRFVESKRIRRSKRRKTVRRLK